MIDLFRSPGITPGARNPKGQPPLVIQHGTEPPGKVETSRPQIAAAGGTLQPAKPCRPPEPSPAQDLNGHTLFEPDFEVSVPQSHAFGHGSKGSVRVGTQTGTGTSIIPFTCEDFSTVPPPGPLVESSVSHPDEDHLANGQEGDVLRPGQGLSPVTGNPIQSREGPALIFRRPQVPPET